ncbi:hypothetical protein [Blastomonas aquatica]|nr:hypothetical protein [Blastomonas aquatica]
MRELHEATDAGNVSWSEGASQDSFICSRKSFNLHISLYFDPEEGVTYYNFSINGKKSASFSVSSLENDFKFMNDFHSSIQINANGLDGIAKEFFGD